MAWTRFGLTSANASTPHGGTSSSFLSFMRIDDTQKLFNSSLLKCGGWTRHRKLEERFLSFYRDRRKDWTILPPWTMLFRWNWSRLSRDFAQSSKGLSRTISIMIFVESVKSSGFFCCMRYQMFSPKFQTNLAQHRKIHQLIRPDDPISRLNPWSHRPPDGHRAGSQKGTDQWPKGHRSQCAIYRKQDGGRSDEI